MLFNYSNFYIKGIILANSGLPLFAQSFLYQIILIIPIIAIEAYVHRKFLEIRISKAVWVALITNVISTIVGIAFFMMITTSVGIALFQTMAPVQPGRFPFLPLEIIYTLIPMLWVSVGVESLIGFLLFRGMIYEIGYSKVMQSFLLANAFTYLMLEVLAVSQLVKGYIEGR